MFRDLEVGEVLGWDVGEMARDITVHAFVREPFDQVRARQLPFLECLRRQGPTWRERSAASG